MIEIKIIKKYESGLRVEGLYSHKGKFGTVIDSTEAFTTLKWDGAKKASTVQSHKIRPFASRLNAETALDAPKPATASAYVDNIPDWFEAEIKALDADNIAYFAADLSQSLVYGNWNHRLDNKASIGNSAYELLEFSDRDVFKGLLQWVVMELI